MSDAKKRIEEIAKMSDELFSDVPAIENYVKARLDGLPFPKLPLTPRDWRKARFRWFFDSLFPALGLWSFKRNLRLLRSEERLALSRWRPRAR